MSIDFRSDPIGNRFKGWKQPAYNPRTKLVSGWEPRPEFGAGQSEGLLPDATQPLVPDDEAGLPPPLPYDWGAIRAAVFPQGLGPAPDPDPDLTAHLGGSVAKPAASVYDPSQARTLSLAAPASKPPARPPAASTSAQAAGGPGGAPRSSSQQQFVSDLLPTAQAMGRRLGIPWQVLMAIPANETGWGASVFHNNYFGIKGPGAPARTWEVVNGKRQDITDSFRTFDSPEGSMAGFAQLMQDNPRYAPALEQLRKDPTNWPAFVSMIHSAGYATDPQWAQKVIRIGQGLESADSMPHAGMSTVTPTGSLLDVARSPLGGKHPAGGTNQPSGYVFPVQGYTQTVPDHWGEVKGGSDLFAPRGTPVMAMRGGKVVSAGNNSVGGNAVTIQGDDGLEYYYAHLDAPPSVKTGDTISAGTFLGPVGDTGNAKGKGTHLHIGIGPSIREGSDKYGGTGGDFDAVGLMNNVLKGDTSATKGTYTDDASYVAWAYRNGLGKNLPSTVNALYVSSKPISAKDALPGDLVMYNMNSTDPGQQHVAIYAGDGQMLHNNDGVKQEGVWPGAEFRRLSGVKPGQLSRPTRTPSPAIANPIVKYRDNGNNTWTATHTDGSTTLEHSLTTIAPVEGGRHPMTLRPGFGKMGGGQEGFTAGDGSGGIASSEVMPSRQKPVEDVTDLMSDPEARKQALRDQGWTEGAIETASNVPTKVWGTPPPPGPVWAAGYTPPTPTPPQSIGDALTSDPGHIDMYSAPISEARGQTAGTGEPITPQRVYEHEAHHAIDELAGGRGESAKRYQSTYDNAADVLEDLNVVRNYAATHSDRDLFDSVNDTLWQYHNDPAHANHYVGLLAREGLAPEWYRAKYFDYLKSTPEWTGTRAQSPTLSMMSPRVEGQPSYEDEQLAQEQEARRKSNWDQQMGTGQEGFTDGGGGGLDPSTPQETPEQRRAREDAEWDKRWKEYQQSQEGTSPFILGGVGDALGALGTATQPARDTVGETIGGAASALGTTAQGTVAQATAPAQLAPGQQSARDQLGQAAQPVGEALGTAAQPVGEALGTAAQGVVNQATAPAQLAPGQQSARDQIGEALGATAETVVPPVARTGGNALQAFGEATGSPSEAYPAGGPLAGPITGEFRQEAGTQQLTKEFEQQTGVSYADFEKRLATEGASGNFSPETVALSDVWNSLGGMAGALPAYSRMSPEEQAAQAETPGALASTLISTALMPGTVVKTPIGMIRAAAAMVAAPGNIPIVGPLTAAEEIGRATEVGAPLIKALAKSPVGKFLVEDGGQASLNMMGKTGLATGGGGVLGSAIGVSPDIANPRIDDPNWWAQVKNDAAVGFGTGALVGMGVTGAKYGLDQTITPGIMEAFRAIFNPRENIPDPLAQVAAADRANAINHAGTWADILGFQGRNEFGKAGQGLNTAEAAAFAETNRTLIGFTAADGSTVTPSQEAWLQARLAYEDLANQRLNAAGVLGPTQNVASSVGEPGPSVHITHLYEPDVNAAKQNATRGQRLGWRDATIVHARGKTLDPNVDPDVPRTIAEAIAEHARDPLGNKAPLDDLVTRFEVSAYQTEKTLANRAFYDAIKPPGVAGPGTSVAFKGVAPDTWVRPKEQWGFGHGVDQMRFEPKLAKYLDNISGATESADWLRWYGENVSAPLKAGLFVGSPIHAFNVAWRAFSELGALKTADLFRSYIMPTMFSGGYGNLLLARLPLALDAAEHGLTGARVAAEGITPRYGATGGMVRTGVAGLAGAGMGWTQARARGQTEDEAKQAALWGAALSIPMTLPGAGAIIKAFGKDVDVEAAASMADVLHHGIFREGMPAAKLGMYEILTKAGVDKDIAATTINNTIGGIDQLKMGRSPWVQDLMRYGLIASDWTEGQVKTMANAFMPNQMGAHTRQSVVRGLATYMTQIEILNQMFNGHPTWENGDGNEYKLEITGMLNGLYHLSGNQVDLRSIDPVDKTPQRSFVDVMPPMRWMMETIGEGSRQLAYNQGQLESTFGGPAGAAAGQRLQDYAGPDLVKPSLRDKLIEDVQSRIGPGPGLIGAASEAAKGQQYDWTGKPMEKPDFSTWTGWADWAGHLVSPFAPASGTAVMRNINVPHPERSEWGDAVTEFLGLTRVNRTSELGEKRSEADEIKKKVLNISPDQDASIQAKHQAQIDANDQKRVAAFAALEAPDSTIAHVDHEKTMHDIATERKALTTRQNIAESYASQVPEGPLRDTVQQILENVWNVPGSPLPADLKPTTDVAELAKNYWSPTGINVADDLALRKARRNILNEFAYTHDEDPDALEDLIKWQAQHQDDLSKSTPPPKTLPGVSSGQLGQIATDYLHASEDEHGHLIEDIDVRGDKMRAFLKDNAKQIGVAPEDLMERINLRLAGVGQTTPIERSYNTALQTFFQSHDEDQFPRYKNADGTPLGDRAKWDIWDGQIASLGQAKAKNFEEWQGRVEAKERAQNDRDKWLLNHTSRTDYERWFGVGRGMTERRWQEYRTGTGPVGYEDLALDKDLQPPKDETARRDRIQQMYRASNLDERLDTEVWVWQQGDYVPMNLKGAERYIRHFQIPEPGRKLDDLAAHDEADPKLRPSLRLDTVEEAANATK